MPTNDRHPVNQHTSPQHPVYLDILRKVQTLAGASVAFLGHGAFTLAFRAGDSVWVATQSRDKDILQRARRRAPEAGKAHLPKLEHVGDAGVWKVWRMPFYATLTTADTPAYEQHLRVRSCLGIPPEETQREVHEAWTTREPEARQCLAHGGMGTLAKGAVAALGAVATEAEAEYGPDAVFDLPRDNFATARRQLVFLDPVVQYSAVNPSRNLLFALAPPRFPRGTPTVKLGRKP